MNTFECEQSGGSKQPSSSLSAPSINETIPKKLFKVCDSNGAERKCMVATSYDDLLLVIKEKFQLSMEFRIVLEEDDAEIDDNECFQRLPEFTKFKFLPLRKRARTEHSEAENTTKVVESSDHWWYGIGGGTWSQGSFTILFKTLTGKTFTLQVQPSDTVRMVKDQIWFLSGIALQDQRLIYSGRQLGNDRHTLRDLNILSGATLHLLVKLRGPNSFPDFAGMIPMPERSGPFPIPFTVSMQNGRVVRVWMMAEDTVATLKEQIRREEAIPILTQVLIFRGEELDDKQTISHYSLEAHSKANLILQATPRVDSNEAPFQIFLKTLMMKTITVWVRASDTVELLKEKIYSKENMHPETIGLIHPELKRALENEKSLAHYNIQPKSTLHLVLCPRG